MFDALARFADRRARRVGIFAVAFFLFAGAVGGSVAERLDPYGADDPETEAVEARKALQRAGHRVPGAIVVVRDADVETAAGRARVAALARELRAQADVASVSGYLDTRSTFRTASPATRRWRWRS